MIKMELELKIKNRIKELESEFVDTFLKSTEPKTHILMRRNYRTTANELSRVKLELEKLL